MQPQERVELKGVRVLIVDDNEVNCRVLTEQLAAHNMRPTPLTSPAEAREALTTAETEGDPFRIAVLDSEMPEIDGETLGRAIKMDPRLSDTALVILSSVANAGDRVRFEKAAFAAYLVKPVRRSDLLDVLATVHGATLRGRTTTPMLTLDSLVASRAGRQKTEAAVSNDLLGARILVAEDNILNQKVAALVLKKIGCQVDIASNGKEALEMWSQSNYDAILMDCQMPEMDGYASTREIRRRENVSLEAIRRVPIIAMTASAMQADMDKCLVAGMDAFISKPVEIAVMQRILAFWVKGREKKASRAEELTK